MVSTDAGTHEEARCQEERHEEARKLPGRRPGEDVRQLNKAFRIIRMTDGDQNGAARGWTASGRHDHEPATSACAQVPADDSTVQIVRRHK